ncbi:MAG: hypothetical protein ACYC2U_04530, partial [Candidatus Amoebophilus sp.]
DAQYRLGRMYKNGWGENPENTKDDEEAVEWFQKAAGQEHADAQYRLGRMYEKDLVELPDEEGPDYSLAMEYYDGASEKGHTGSCYRLGEIYEDGLLDQQLNYKTAKKYYEEAAKNGYEAAKVALKRCELKIKADTGDGNAQYELAEMYATGQLGIKRNYKEAVEWYKKANKKGNKKASKKLLEYDTDSEEEADPIAKQKGKVVNKLSEDQRKQLNLKLKDLNQNLKSGNEINPTKYPSLYIPIYRGVHYVPRLFPDKNARKAIRQLVENKLPLYSSSAYEASDLSFLNPHPNDHTRLKKNAEAIKNALNSFRNSFPVSYHKFHEIYSNDHGVFHAMLGNPLHKTNAADTEEVSQAFFNYVNFLGLQVKNMPDFKMEKAVVRNPHVSFSLIPYHAVKYATGDKSFHNPNGGPEPVLDIDYDMYGKPKYPYLGKVYVAFLTLEDFLKINPYTVLQHHASGKIKISTPHWNNILKENEITISGYLPKDKVIETKSIRCPIFNQESYPKYYEHEHGLDEKKWKLFKSKCKNNESITQDLYRHIEEKQASNILSLAQQAAIAKEGILIYPGFKNDFILFPLSSRAAEVYAEIKGGKEKIVYISPEPGKESLETEEILYLAQDLIDNTVIEEFTIRDFNIGELGFKLFAKILQKNTYITTLELEKTEPTGEGVKALANALKNNETLTDLNIKGNLEVGNQIASIAELLTKNTTLKRLDIGNVGLTNEKAKKLKKVFTGKKPQNTTLIWMNLDGNDLTGTGKILNRLKKNKKEISTLKNTSTK